jgi:hypothetical protein
MYAANIAKVVRDTNGAELTFVECAPRLARTAQARLHPAQNAD